MTELKRLKQTVSSLEIKFHDIDQNSDLWMGLRAGLVTASEFNKACAGRKTKTFIDFVNQKREERINGIASEGFSNEWTERGHELEPVARLEYELQTGNIVLNGGFFDIGIGIGASPDGLVGDDGQVEIKCPKESTFIDYQFNGKLPTTYKRQVFGQMMCTGRKWCDFVAYHPDHELFIVRVERDDDYIAWLFKDILETVNIINELIF